MNKFHFCKLFPVQLLLLVLMLAPGLVWGQMTDQGPLDDFLQGGGGGMNGFGGTAQQRLPKTSPLTSAPTAKARTPDIVEISDKASTTESTPKNTAVEALVPVAPNLFQTFIQRTTGTLLPIFGQDLFNRVNSFSEQQSAPVPGDYVVGPGDELLLKIYGGSVNFDQRAVVDRDGMIALPKVGPVLVTGIRVSELEKHLKARISKVISHFNLFVTMGQLRGIEVYAVGQVRKPGKYVVGGLSTVISALFVTGGPTSNGTMRNVQLVRNSKVIATVDLYDFLLKGDTSKDRRLLSGDVINILPVGPSLALKGAVPVQAIFELGSSGTASLKDILGWLGGNSSQISPLQVTLERIEPTKERPLSARKLTLFGEDLSTPLKDGDVLTFFPIKAAFENAITLRVLDEEVVRVPVGPNTRIKDVLPSREILMTHPYFLRKFGVTCTPNSPAPSGPLKCGPAQDQKGGRANLARIRGGNGADQVNWELAIIERPNPNMLATEVIQFHLAKAIEGDDANNLPVMPGDTITVFSQKDVLVPAERQTHVVRIEGEINAPGIYQIKPGETLPALIKRAGGMTTNAFIYGTVLSRASVRARQMENLQGVIRRLEAQVVARGMETVAGATESAELARVSAMQNQNAQNSRAQIDRMKALIPNGRISLQVDPTNPELPEFRLEDGDEISIPNQPDYVAVVGAVHNENVMIYRQGSRVSGYLDMAGVAEYADKSEVFVARADGSIEPPAATGAMVYPGDTIVVPEKYYRESGYSIFMRGLRDWTQVFFQLGLGAAAIHTLGR